MLADKTSKLSLFNDKDKSPKSKQNLTKKDKGKGVAKCETASSASANINGLDNLFGQANMEPKLGEMASGKKECVPDPYEFNAKVEDGIAMPIKKLKVEKEKVYFKIYSIIFKAVNHLISITFYIKAEKDNYFILI